MLRRIALAAGLTCLGALPAHAAGDAAAGMTALSTYNLIVLGDWEMDSDVEGRAIATGNAGNSSGKGFTIGSGRSAQGALPSTGPTLVVGGDLNIVNVNVNNGPNGSSGTVAAGSSVLVRGNVVGNMNLNGEPRSLAVGGNFNGNANNLFSGLVGGNMLGGNMGTAGGGSIKLGGTVVSGNANGNVQTGVGASVRAGVESQVDSLTAGLSDNLHALSSTLADFTLASNPSFLSASGGGQTLVLNAVTGSNGFALFNLSASDFAGYTSIAYNFEPDTGPVIVNFTGDLNFALNFVSPSGTDPFSAVNQSILWNFTDATNLVFNTEFFGSVLATNAEVTNRNSINGSLVAASFKQAGEVHLGTFRPFDLPPPAVPEPTSWALMILGFGLAGGALRRRQSVRIRFA